MPLYLWVATRFLIPLAAAAYLLIDRWGKENLVFYLAIPPFFLVFRMFLSQFERPDCPQRQNSPAFQRAVSTWHACDLIGLLFLMLFEGTIAGIAEEKAQIALPYVIAFGGMLLPYTILAAVARIHSNRARCLVEVSGQDVEST